MGCIAQAIGVHRNWPYLKHLKKKHKEALLKLGQGLSSPRATSVSVSSGMSKLKSDIHIADRVLPIPEYTRELQTGPLAIELDQNIAKYAQFLAGLEHQEVLQRTEAGYR